MNNQKFYDIVDSFREENIEEYSLIDEKTVLDMADTLEELFESEEYSTKDLKAYVRDNLTTDIDYVAAEYDIDEETFENFKIIAEDMGWDLKKDLLDRAEDIQYYDMELNEFVEMAIEEWQIFGEVNDRIYNYIDYEKVWNSLLRFDFTYTEKVGYVYTSM